MSDNRRILWLLIAGMLAWAPFACPASIHAADDDPTPIPIAALDRKDPVQFQKEILPVLRKKCLACHNATDAESELVLETPKSIIKGGSNGPGVIPGDSGESYLLKLAGHQEEPVMPPADNESGADPMTSMELALVKLWIDQGAQGEVTNQPQPLNWQPVPANIRPILAATISDDRQFAVCSRGNRLFLYHLPSGRLLQELTDPALEHNAAHLDLVQSIAFHPNNQLMATGGYRTVKLWQRGQVSMGEFAMSQPTTALAVSTHFIALGHEDGTMDLVSRETNQVAGTLAGHAAKVNAMAFATDGKTLYSIAADKTLRVWDVTNRTASASVALPDGGLSLAVLADGKHLVTGGEDNIIRAWALPIPADTAELKPVREISGHNGPVTALAAIVAAPDQFVSGSADATVRHWRVSDGKQIRQLDHGGAIRALAVRADGQRIASGGDNQVTKLWNAADGAMIAELKGNHELAYSIARLQQKVQLTKAEMGAQTNRVKESKKQLDTRRKAAEKATADKDAASKDKEAKQKALADLKQQKTDAENNQTILASTQAETKALSDSLAARREATTKPIAELTQLIQATRDKSGQPGNEAITGKIDELKAAADALTKQQEAGLDQLSARLTELAKLARQKVDENKKRIEEVTKQVTKSEKAATDAEKKVKDTMARLAASQQDVKRAEADLATAQQEVDRLTATLTSRETEHKSLQDQFGASQSVVAAISFTGDGQLFAVAQASGPILLYDANTGQPGDVLAGHTDRVQHVASLGETDLISLSADNQARIWNTSPPWKLVRTIGGAAVNSPLADRVMAMDFQPFGDILATASGQPTRNGRIDMWNISDGSLVRSIDEAHSDSIYGIEFSPTGQMIASASADRMVKVFNTESGEFIRGFEGHTHHVLDVSWQANEKRIASAGADKVIKIWDVATGEQKRTIGGIGKEVTSISFVGITANAISTAGDSQIRLHDTGNGKTIRAMNGGGDFVYASAVSWDGKRAISGGMKSILQVWDTNNGKLLHSLKPVSDTP